MLARGDRAGAEGLLSQALRLDPNHQKAQETMRSLRASTDSALFATPAPTGAPVPLKRTTWASRAQVDGPQATAAPRPPAAGGLDLEAVRGAARQWREQLSSPAPARPAPQATPLPALVEAEAEEGAQWSLLVVTGPQRGEQLLVGATPVVVGCRDPALDLSYDPFASPAHAALVVRNGALVLLDGGSTSGTWHTIDGTWRLAPGESFSAGLQRLRYLGPLPSPSQAGVPELGGPLPAASWRLEQTLMGLRPGRAWVLRGIVTVGRDNALLGFADDSALAGAHVDLRPTGADLELVDRSEGLGTWVCLPHAGERVVPPGALVRVGSTVLQPSPR